MHKKGSRAAPPTGKWTSGEGDIILPKTFAQWSSIFMLPSVLMCAGLYFIPENQGHLCVCLSLTQVHTWIISKESVIHPYKQKNEARCSQTTQLECYFVCWPSLFHKVSSKDHASDPWRCRLKGLISWLDWHPGICSFIRFHPWSCFLLKFKSLWPQLLT